jgi:hypothetical protein
MKLRNALVALGLGLLTCHQAILTAPQGSTLTLFVNPMFIPANGGKAVVSAFVLEPAGTPVPDGTVVQFFTTLGSIKEQEKTNDGVARVNLVSDSHSGTATVTAQSGEASDEVPEVKIGAVRAAKVFVAADPVRITDSRSTQVVATVYDGDGNPVPNIPVIFEVTATQVASPPPSPSPAPAPGPATTEYMDSGGAPQYTDNNGRARDVMRTRHPREAAQKIVTITATTSNGTTATTLVTIN